MAAVLAELLLGGVNGTGVMDLLAFRWSGSRDSRVIPRSFMCVLRGNIHLA